GPRPRRRGTEAVVALSASGRPVGISHIERRSEHDAMFSTFSGVLLGIGNFPRQESGLHMSNTTRRRVLQAAAGAIALGLTATLSGCVGGAAQPASDASGSTTLHLVGFAVPKE